MSHSHSDGVPREDRGLGGRRLGTVGGMRRGRRERSSAYSVGALRMSGPLPRFLLLSVLLLSILAPPPVMCAKKRKVGSSSSSSSPGPASSSDCPGLAPGSSPLLADRLSKAEQLLKSDIPGAVACAVHSRASGPREVQRRAEVLFAVAATAHSRMLYREAMVCFTAMPEATLAKWGQASHLLGILQLHTGDAAGAVKALRRASELLPLEPLIYTALAQAHYNTDDPQGAIKVWERGCSSMPAHPDAFFNVGILLRELGTRLEESARSYKTSIRLQPTNARYRYSYGNLLYDVGMLGAASAAYRGALRADPGHEDASNNLGNSLRQAGRLGEAREALEKAMKLSPHNTNLLLNAGQIYQDLGMTARVEKVATLAFSLNPSSMEASLLLGSVSYIKGELTMAAEHYRRARSANTLAQQPLLNLANTLGDTYRQMEARISNQNEETRSRMRAIHAESIDVYEALLRNNPGVCLGFRA